MLVVLWVPGIRLTDATRAEYSRAAAIIHCGQDVIKGQWWHYVIRGRARHSWDERRVWVRWGWKGWQGGDANQWQVGNEGEWQSGEPPRCLPWCASIYVSRKFTGYWKLHRMKLLAKRAILQTKVSTQDKPVVMPGLCGPTPNPYIMFPRNKDQSKWQFSTVIVYQYFIISKCCLNGPTTKRWGRDVTGGGRGGERLLMVNLTTCLSGQFITRVVKITSCRK